MSPKTDPRPGSDVIPDADTRPEPDPVPGVAPARGASSAPDAESERGSSADLTIVVHITRTGGIAGMRRQWEANAPAGDEEQWIAAIRECPWNEEATESPLRTDGFTWRFVAKVPPAEKEATVPDGAITEPWSHLIELVQQASS